MKITILAVGKLKEKYLRVMDESGGDTETLPLPAGQPRRRQAVPGAGKSQQACEIGRFSLKKGPAASILILSID